jgi:DNA-binding response OmpR family regulator
VAILIVDSNENFSLIYKRKLKGLLTKVDFAKSVEEVKKSLDRRKYSLIIVSHVLKNMSGVDMYNYIRRLGFKGDIVIAVTAHDKDVIRNSYNGIKGVLQKCTNGKDFRSQVRKLIKENSQIVVNEEDVSTRS